MCDAWPGTVLEHQACAVVCQSELLHVISIAFLQDVERYKQAFQRSGGTPLIDYYRALVDGMALGTAEER